MKRLNISFMLRGNENGKSPIYLRMTLDNERAELSTKQWIEPSQWDKTRQEVKGRSEEARTINIYLMDFKTMVQQKFNLLIENNEHATLEDLKEIIRNKKAKGRTLINVFEENNQLSELEVGRKYAQHTVNQYKTTLERIKLFVQTEYQRKDINLEDLNANFIRKFEIFLRTKYGIDVNTVMKYLKQLKKVIHYAMDLEYISNDPFRSYKTAFKETNRGFLTTEELAEIETHHFPIKRIDQVRDVFVFVCYTGLSYSDLAKLNRESIKKGIDGNNWIMYHREKTNVRASIPILPPAQSIIDKYANDPYCNSQNQLIPVISNQKLNAYLTEIASICGIDKNITMHLGRHTFATTVTLTNGIPIETVSKMLGHKSISTTQIYSKVVDTKIARDMEKLNKKFSAPVVKANTGT